MLPARLASDVVVHVLRYRVVIESASDGMKERVKRICAMTDPMSVVHVACQYFDHIFKITFYVGAL